MSLHLSGSGLLVRQISLIFSMLQFIEIVLASIWLLAILSVLDERHVARISAETILRIDGAAVAAASAAADNHVIAETRGIWLSQSPYDFAVGGRNKGRGWIFF
ncbi:hypothetical protein AAFG07_11295 [Bradyrhizobium sp. B097]|uniref:hypothetical protein n=1 Tax=Bradyrhizobium sp. B097 TaxID=3140244 RepID=UPI0031835DBD